MTFRDALTSSPMLCPLGYDAAKDIVQFVELSEADYRAASFLDGRLLTPAHKPAFARWSEVRTLAEQLPVHCDFIFHISHCGSTLLARLLGELPGVFCLREPGPLRVCVTRPTECRGFLGLLSRTFRPEQRALIKCTSFVSEIAPLLMNETSRALLLFIPLKTFLPALLGGAFTDIEQQSAERQRRLQTMLGREIPMPTSPGELVAHGWLCEMMTLMRLARQFVGRCLMLDFDRFLAEPEQQFAQVSAHFGQTPGDAWKSPLVTRYAKNPKDEYDSTRRRQLLEQAAVQHAEEVQRGLAWIEHYGEPGAFATGELGVTPPVAHAPGSPGSQS